MTFGSYPKARAALSILLRVAGATLAPLVNVRETAETDTPARLATCRAVTPLSLDFPFVGGTVYNLTRFLQNRTRTCS
jgi:hypothetical protein